MAEPAARSEITPSGYRLLAPPLDVVVVVVELEVVELGGGEVVEPVVVGVV
jgi:hypothetical protein